METIKAENWQHLRLIHLLEELFGDLDSSALRAFQDHLVLQHLSNGDIIFRQGNPEDGM